MSTSTGTLATPAQLADQQAIQAVLASHSRALDRLDADLLKDCYWPEGEVDYGSFKGPAHTFAELVVPVLAQQYELTRHALSNTLFQIGGDTALTETYVHAAHLVHGAGEEVLVYGRYLDRLQRRADCWKLLHRQVIIEWSNRLAVVDERDSDAFRELTRGAQGDKDPLCQFLKQ
ncbi:MAG: hypothetical protein CME59_22150 [Halioglobus sp.]|nr:hypothetical protein [Halioglobus sp.]|tara:strand:+ start:7152 stop:7676 length:525 start_codon:yes stop_codon:yes gene_type:complete